MKIQFEENELEGLPDSIRGALSSDHTFEGEPTGIVEDVAGLKGALEKEREGRKESEQLVGNIADKLGSDRSNILSAVDSHLQSAGDANASKREVADMHLKVAVAEADGNVHALPANIKERMEWSDELGKYIVPAEDGQPLKNDDGSLKGVVDVVVEMKADAAFAGLFKATDMSGSGSGPQHSGDGPSALAADDSASTLPAFTTPRSQMSRQQKVAIASAGENFEQWPL